MTDETTEGSPSASVEEVARVAHPELWGAWPDENAKHFSKLAEMRATSLRRAGDLLASFNITPKETPHD